MKESAHARRQPFSRLVRTTRSVQVHLNCPEPVYRQNRSIGDAFLCAVTPARVCDMWNIKQESDSHYSFPPPRNALIVAAISPTSELAGTFGFARIAPFSAPRFSQPRVRCSRLLYKELSSFDMAPFKTCETFLGMSYLWQLCCFKQEVSTCFLHCIRYHHTHTHEHKSNLKLQSKNNTALLVAPIESAQSLLYSLSGKDTTAQTLRLTHRLDLRLIGVLSGAIAE